MAKYGFELDSAGVIALLKSAEMSSVCESYASAIEQSAGEDFESKQLMGRTRVTYIVYPTSIEASKKNQKYDILTKAMGAARR